MIRNYPRLILAFAVLQALVFASWYGYEHWRFMGDQVHYIRIKPRIGDPYSPLSGRYLTLSFDFSQVKDALSEKNVNMIWVQLKKVGDFFEYDRLLETLPETLSSQTVVIQCKVTYSSKDVTRVVSGLERLYIPEWEKEPKRDDMVLEVAVLPSGAARIHQVLVKGKPWKL